MNNSTQITGIKNNIKKSGQLVKINPNVKQNPNIDIVVKSSGQITRPKPDICITIIF